MGMSATLEGEPPVDLGTESPGLRGEPDKHVANARNCRRSTVGTSGESITAVSLLGGHAADEDGPRVRVKLRSQMLDVLSKMVRKGRLQIFDICGTNSTSRRKS